jgi:hypothetical protein
VVSSSVRRPPTLWTGWIVFAGVMLGVVGSFNVITGLAALLADDVYVGGDRVTVALDVTSWGWVHLIWGAIMVAAGVALMAGRLWARMLAVFLVSVNMMTQLLVMPGYPFWALLVIAVDAVVIWAILVHGEELEGR